MSRFAILRIEKRNLKQARAMAEHALRDGLPVPNADTSRTSLNRILVGASRASEVMQEIRKVLPPRRRKDAVLVVEALMTFSPEVMLEWSDKKQHAYLAEALCWIAKRFGGPANIMSAVVHLDETTPHLQILLVPLDDGRLRGNHFIGGPAALRKMQTAFADEVAKRYGLARGLERRPGMERVTHTDVASFYASLRPDVALDGIPPRVPLPPLPTPLDLSSFADETSRAEGRARWEAERRRIEQEREQSFGANRAHYEALTRWAAVGLRSTRFGVREAQRRMYNIEVEIEQLEAKKALLHSQVAELEERQNEFLDQETMSM